MTIKNKHFHPRGGKFAYYLFFKFLKKGIDIRADFCIKQNLSTEVDQPLADWFLWT